MERCKLTFRVFVSPTFIELVAERDALQAHVFPPGGASTARNTFGSPQV